MADDVTLKGALATFVAATDEIGGKHYQRVKVTFGTDGTAGDVTASNPLPVAIQGALGTVALDAPTLAALENITVGGTVDLGSASLAALESITATGPLTDTQLRATPVSISAGTLPLPTGAATETTLATIAGAVKAEDSASADGDPGFVVLAQRRDTDAPTAGSDGDYTTLKMDEAGRLKTASQPAKYALVTGNITANGQTVFCQCDRGSNVIAHVVATSLVGHNSTFEGSIDSTNGTDGAWFAIDAKRTNANTVDLVTGVLAATPGYAWEFSVNGFNFIRVRATAHTSGTATWKFQQAPYATEPVPVTQVTGTQPVSGTVTATVTAGTVNPVVPATPYILNSAATTNEALILTGTSGLQAFYATNTGASPAFVKLYNKATAPVSTDIPAMILPVPAAVGGVPGVCTLPIGFSGFRFALGLGIRITGAVADNDATAVAAGQVKVMLSRTI